MKQIICLKIAKYINRGYGRGYDRGPCNCLLKTIIIFFDRNYENNGFLLTTSNNRIKRTVLYAISIMFVQYNLITRMPKIDIICSNK